MTEVEKVSIGGYAFTLEVEAYALVKQYLDELEAYYAQREGGAEVMEGFEERMAELLYEKCADDGVASLSEVQEIIAVLGKPSAIEAEDGPEPVRPESPADAGKAKGRKRLFRDPTNKMIGGVCSGLAAYFRFDVVWIRIIFIALTILTGVVSCHVTNHHFDSLSVNLWFPLIYVILWIAMPEAKTVQQRWQMGVTNPPAGATAPSSAQPKGSGMGRLLRIVIGVLLLLTAVFGLTFGLAALFGHSLFGWDVLWTGVEEHLPGLGRMAASVFYRVTLLMTVFLPFVGILYGGIMMIFDLRSPSWRPGLVIFLLWIVALTVFTVLSLMGFFSLSLFN